MPPQKKSFLLIVLLLVITLGIGIVTFAGELNQHTYLPQIRFDQSEITPQPTATPTYVTPGATPTGRPVTATPPPNLSGNLLNNPNFDFDLSEWEQVHNIWIYSNKVSNPSPNNSAAKMGQDVSGGWSIGDEDWLYQDVTAPPNNSVTFQITEIQHGYDRAEIRIFGRNGGTWQLLWFRPEPDAPPATHAYDWYTFTYTISGGYEEYRLEFYGRLNDPDNGWKFTLLSLTTE